MTTGITLSDTANNPNALSSITAIPLDVIKGGTGATTQVGAQSSLGLGTISTQNSNSVSITGGSISGITDLAISDGGTGASTVENARVNLGSIGVLSTTTGINGLSVAQTTLYTPSGHTAIVIGANIRITTASGLTGTMHASIGTNAGATDIFADTTLTAFNTITETWRFSSTGNYVTVSSGTAIKFSVNTAFGGTIVTIAVDLQGYLI